MVRHFLGDRFRASTVEGRTLDQEYGSDRGRLIQSSPFRRLQQKAQVFALEPNAAVRSRLTHSLEVANLGLQIATMILKERGAEILGSPPVEASGASFLAICENACLMHDIGNPPFGHFGECAIRDWFREHGEELLEDSGALKQRPDYERSFAQAHLLPDFLGFDGNAQGLRVVTRLQGDYSKAGLNLTLSTRGS